MFFKYISGEIQPSLQKEDRDTHRDVDKTEVFNLFFASVFSTGNEPRRSQCPELEVCNCKNDQFLAEHENGRDLLLQLDPYESTGPDGINPRTPQRAG